MRKTVLALMAVLLTLGCSKDKISTRPCRFDLQVDWVKGSRAQITITPEDPAACYVCGLMYDRQIQDNLSDKEQMAAQLQWMEHAFQSALEQHPDATFQDMFCYKGVRSIRETQLSPDIDYRLVVFQVNPATHEAIGDVLYSADFHTRPIPESDCTFRIQYSGSTLRILPSNQDTWFWEYDLASRLTGVYGSPYFFYYSIIDMYDQYGFLDYNLCQGPAEWVFPRDDRSIREDEPYTLALSGCADDEITTPVYYADFILRNGQLEFLYSDIPAEQI